MGFPIAHGAASNELAIDATRKALRVSLNSRGAGFFVTGITGTMAAALGANSAIFTQRLDPSAAGAVCAFIDRIRLTWTTIVAFTTPITAGRRLALFRGSATPNSGGTGLVSVRAHNTFSNLSECDTARSGDIRIATTAALGGSPSFESDPFRTVALTHVGTAGAYFEKEFEFTPGELVLDPGELISVRNPVAMDAAGTWQLTVDVSWREIVTYP